MKIGLYECDKTKFPNLPLMKLSAYHKRMGDSVEWAIPLEHYDIVYVSKVFGDEYSKMNGVCFQADKVVYGGSGFAIKIENGKEVYQKDHDKNLPHEIEHIYPDYSLYPQCKNTAYGFLTRGCCNNCEFCIVSKKEGCYSIKVANLDEFWKGQKKIVIMDPNILACQDRDDLLRQLADSGAKVEFTQGLDARFITKKVAELLSRIRLGMVHFAFDSMKNEKEIRRGLECFNSYVDMDERNKIVYILTNFNTTIKEDLYRLNEVKQLGFTPDVRIYRKQIAPRAVKDLQRWCNNRFLYRSTDLFDYVPRKDGKSFLDLYKDEIL